MTTAFSMRIDQIRLRDPLKDKPQHGRKGKAHAVYATPRSPPT
jgi:hypothetical protein